MTTKTDATLTKWETGNVLVKLSDDLSDASTELNGSPDLRDMVDNFRRVLADRFNRDFTDEMGFGL